MRAALKILKDHYKVDNDFDICIMNDVVEKRNKESQIQRDEWLKDVIAARDYIHGPHNISHVASAFYQSPFKEALVLHYDGVGDDRAFNLYYARPGSIKKLSDFKVNHPGLYYRMPAMSLKEIRKTRKDGTLIRSADLSTRLMDLASFGNIRDDWELSFRTMYEAGSIKTLALNLNINLITETVFRTYAKLNKDSLFYEEIEGKKAFDIAKTNQYVFEEMVLTALDSFVGEYRNIPLIITGGCAYNTKINEILRQTYGNEIFIPPNPDDSGITLGQIFLTEQPKEQVKRIKGIPLLGQQTLHKLESTVVTEKQIAELLQANKIIGIVNDDCEIGHHPMGNRVIIGKPSEEVRNRVLRIKNFEWYRQLECACRLEDTNTYFNFDHESEFCSFSPKARKEYKEKLSGVLNPRQTAKLKTVSEDQNLFLHNILSKFESPILCASFSEDYSTPVITLSQVIGSFKRTDIDYLVINGRLISK